MEYITLTVPDDSVPEITRAEISKILIGDKVYRYYENGFSYYHRYEDDVFETTFLQNDMRYHTRKIGVVENDYI